MRSVCSARRRSGWSPAITASSEGKSGSATLTVTNVPVASVSVSPPSATIAVGGTQQLTATTKDSAGGNLSGRVVTWASSNTAVATVSSSGLTTGVAAGSATITATSEGKSGSAAITVLAAPPPPPAGVADPTLLPVASGQAPNFAAYSALNVASQPAGFSYNDPVTGVRIWKVSSSTVPLVNGTGVGHDYSDGGNEVSLGWGTNNNTHTIMMLPNGISGNNYIVDFTRGVGFSNYRLLTVQPLRDLCFSFSNLASQPRIAYILTGSQLVRYNTATLQVENTGNFPLAISAFGWLHHDKNDVWFTGLLADNVTVWAWNSQTNQYLTHYESWTNEGRLERDGRYIALNGGNNGTSVRLWDLSTNTLGPTQTDPTYWFAHVGNLRGGLWITEDANITNPLAEDVYSVGGGQIVKTQLSYTSGSGLLAHHSGNWVQSDADLGGNLAKQWYYTSGYYTTGSGWLWLNAVGLGRADGSDRRLLCHHYDVSLFTTQYYATPWGKPSPDGKVVIFDSDMNGSGRYDLFVAEVPLKAP